MNTSAWRSWLRKHFGRSRPMPHRTVRTFRPGVEILEDRLAPAVMQPTYVLPQNGGTPVIGGPTGGGYSPQQIRHAYGFDQVTFSNGTIPGDGHGETIAIVDAYNDPNIASNLDTFDQTFSLTTGGQSLYQQYGAASSFLTVYNQSGQVINPTSTSVPVDPAGNGGWELEESLDVEWAHAMAPGAGIVLIEANSSSDANLLAAVSAANTPAIGAVVVSMSWGGPEAANEAGYDSTYFNTPGITYVASSGDTAAGAGWPAVSSHVLAVGGTALLLDSNNNWSSESVWTGSSGGTSNVIPQPSYQQGTVTQSSQFRTNPDVAYDADPNTGVAIYDSYDPANEWGGGWLEIGGTSAGSPQWAALIAVVDQGRALQSAGSLSGSTQTLPKIYQLPSSDFHDITTGTNGYFAGTGYDLGTGLGSPVVNKLVPDMVSDAASAARLGISMLNLKLNGISIANPYAGQTVTVAPTVLDVGQQTANGASIQISTNTPGVTIVGSPTQSLGTISNGTTVQTSNFAIQLSSSLTDLTDVQLTFVLTWTGGQQTVTESFYVVQPKPQAEVKVGFTPGNMVADPGRDVAYMIDVSDQELLAINTDTGVTVSAALAGSPSLSPLTGTNGLGSGQMAVSLDDKLLYVALSSAKKIEVFNLPSLSVAATYSYSSNPNKFTPVSLACGVNNMLYVSTTVNPGVLYQINGLTGQVANTFGSSVGGYYADALLRTSSDGTELFVGEVAHSASTGSLYAYNITGSAPVAFPPPPYTPGINYQEADLTDFTVDAAREQIYATNGGQTSGTYGVENVNLTTGGFLATYPLGQSSSYASAVAELPGSQVLYGGGNYTNGAGVVRYLTQDGTPVGSYTVGSSLSGAQLPDNALKITPNGNLVYIVKSGSAYAVGIIGNDSLAVNPAPTITTPASATPNPVTTTKTTTLSVLGSGGNLTYAWTDSGPAPVTFGTPTASTTTATFTHTGTYYFYATITNTSGQSVVSGVTVTVNPSTLSLTPAPPLPSTQVGNSYSQTFTAGLGTGGYVYSITSGALPNGLTLSAGGALSGTANLAGTFNFTVTATDTYGDTASQAYSVVVNKAPTVTFTPTTLPAATVGSNYTPPQFSAVGGTGGPFTFAITSSAPEVLPPGLTLSSAGQISGTPTTPGSYLFIVTATDNSGDTGSQAYLLTVSNTSTTRLSGPTTVVSDQPASFTVSVTGSGPSPTGLVALYDGSAIIASGQLNSGSVSFQSSTLTLGSHTLTAVYNGDTNYAGSISQGLAVGVVSPNVSDSFGSGNGPLDSSWTVAPNPALTPAGAFAIQSGQAVATGPNFNSAIFSDFTPSDVGVGAFVDVSSATGSAPIYAGLQARLDNNGNSYVGLIASNGSSNLLILGLARSTGVLTFFSVVPIGATSSGNLRLEVFGTALKLYLEGTLMASATDATLTAPGGVGLFSEASPGAKYGGFFGYQLQASPTIYADGFSQAAVPASTTLGAPWSVDQGGFTINASNQAVAVGVQSEATLYGASLTTVDESVSVIRAGTSAGLLVRWNSATQTGYELVVAGTTVSLYAVQNGTATLLNSATVGSGTGTLRLVVSGSSLQAYFDGNSLFTVTNSTITGPGTVGLFSGGGSSFGIYTLNGS